MMPERSIAVPQDAIDAAAVREQLNAVGMGTYTVGVGLKQTGGEFTDRIAIVVYVRGAGPRVVAVPVGHPVGGHRRSLVSPITRLGSTGAGTPRP
jgi:hypothetical protein